MEYFVRALGFLLIPIIVNGVMAYLKQPKQTEKGKVHLPKFFAVLGLIVSAVFLIPAIITAFVGESAWVSVMLLAFSLLGIVFILGFVNCRVDYDESGFVTKNILGIKRKYTYDQVTAIKVNTHESYIYIGKRRVMIDEVSVGGREFIAHVRKKYRTIHNGKSLPRIEQEKQDIFHGNIRDVGGFIFVYITFGIFIVAFGIWAVWLVFSPDTIDNTIEQQVSFVSCVEREDKIILTSSDDEIYKISFIGEDFNAEKIQAIADNETVVTVYSERITPDDEDDYYSISAIVQGESYILTFEETNGWYREENMPIVFLAIIFAIVWGAYVVLSIIVGRNPRKFSRGFVRLFFRDGYVRY